MIDGYNSDIQSEQVQKLAELFPETVYEGKIDWVALKATLGEDVELGEKYGLGWKGKSGVFAKIQEKTVSTLHPQPEESVDWDTTQNMFIEGDNLEALKVLHKAYYGKIKMIYIDPPYNTGNDFVYNDDFKKTRREQALEEGAIDDEGNVTRDDGLRINTGGHKHSNWLDMMYPRLFLARNLLRQDGVIFVSIDDNEVHNLRLMMNEIFGEENFVAELVWNKRVSPANDAKWFSSDHEYLLVFARNKEKWHPNRLARNEKQLAYYKNPDDDARGPWNSAAYTCNKSKAERPNLYYPVVNPNTGEEIWPRETAVWAYSKEQHAKNEANNLIWWGSDGKSKSPRRKQFLDDAKKIVPRSVLQNTDVGSTQSATLDFLRLFDANYFTYTKPVTLLKHLLKVATTNSNHDIVLDFFGGSGSTGQAVNELNIGDDGNRKWIIVQLPELTNEKSEAYRDSYKTIAEIARERIRRAGAKISKDLADKIAERDTPLDLGFRSYVLGDSNFKKWNELVTEPDEIRQQAFDSLNPLEDGATDDDLLTEILLKRGISPLAEVETHDDFVFVPSENLAISLSRHMTEQLFATILAKSPSQIILLDQSFRGDVNLKTNLILQAEKKNISVEVL